MIYLPLIYVLACGFLCGLIIPAFASRFGKILPADPGLVIASLWHKPHFPKTANKRRQELLKHKWEKLIICSLCWGFALMALFAAAFVFIGADYMLWSALFIFFIAISMAVDQQYFLLPDFFTIPLLFAGFGFSVYTGMITPEQSFLGAFLGYLLCVGAVIIMNLFHPADFGAGDVKMVTALGAWMGYEGLNYTLVISFLIFALMALMTKKRSGAFGPALGVAALIIFFYLYAK